MKVLKVDIHFNKGSGCDYVIVYKNHVKIFLKITTFFYELNLSLTLNIKN